MHDWSKEIHVAIGPLNLSAAREAGIVEELSQHLNDRYEDPVSIAIAIRALAVMTLAAAWFPARRATQINPSQALRTE